MAGTSSCVICGSVTRTVFTVLGYRIGRCLVCGHEAVEPAPGGDHVARVYDDAYFHGGKAGYPDYLAEGDLLRRHGRWYGQLLARYTRPGTVLDVGTAAGFVLQGLQDCGWTGRGVEPNEGMARFGRETLGLTIDLTTFEDFRPSTQYDLVTMIQVLAHLTDVRRALTVCAEVLESRGLLLIESWDRRSWTARILGRYWHEYSPPSVLRWFSLADLERLLGQFGFAKIANGRTPKWISGAHAKSLLNYHMGGHPLAPVLERMTRVIPDRIEIPYPAEDLFWTLFKKQ